MLGACALAVAGRMGATNQDAAVIALHTFLGGTTIEGLARVLALTHSGAVRLVDRLEDAGMLQRGPGSDARTVAIGLTERGHKLAERLLDSRDSTLQAVLAPLADSERAELAALLAKLLGGLTPAGDHDAAGRICRMCDPDACGHPDTCPVTIAAAH